MSKKGNNGIDAEGEIVELTPALSGDVDSRTYYDTCFHSLRKHVGNVVDVYCDRFALTVCDIHCNSSIVDWNFHLETWRILASGNPLAINLVYTWTDKLLHRVFKH